MIRLYHFYDKPDDGRRRKKLAASLTFRARKFAEEVFIDSAERVVVERRGNFRDALEQLLQQRARKQFVRFRQDACQLRIITFNRAHGIVHFRTDVRALRQSEQKIKARIRHEKYNSFRVIRRWIVQA